MTAKNLGKVGIIGALALVLGGCAFFGEEETVDFWEPVTSPDGRFLAYAAKANQTYGLYLLDLETNEERLLVRMENNVLSPSWAPDGTRIVFVSMQEKDNVDLFIVEVESGRISRLTTDAANDMNPYWAPSGLIIFNSDRGKEWGAYAVNPDGTGLRKLSFTRAKP